jgi:hypothetical protein
MYLPNGSLPRAVNFSYLFLFARALDTVNLSFIHVFYLETISINMLQNIRKKGKVKVCSMLTANSVSNLDLVYKRFLWVKIVISQQLLFLSKIYLPKYVCYCIFTYRFSLYYSIDCSQMACIAQHIFSLPYCRVKWIARFIWRQAGTFFTRRIAKNLPLVHISLEGSDISPFALLQLQIWFYLSLQPSWSVRSVLFITNHLVELNCHGIL